MWAWLWRRGVSFGVGSTHNTCNLHVGSNGTTLPQSTAGPELSGAHADCLFSGVWVEEITADEKNRRFTTKS